MNVPFPYAARFQHCYLPGGTGTGKSSTMARLAMHDIKKGQGLTFIDPGADAVNLLLHHIPPQRKDDVIYADMENPVVFDFLSYSKSFPIEKDELAADLIFLVLQDIEHAPRAKSILTRLIYTLLSCTIPVSFLDISHFLLRTKLPGEDESRDKLILKHCTDASLKHYWRDNWPGDKEQEPIIHRMTPYVMNSVLSRVFGNPNPAIRIADCMNQKKILLVNLAGASRTAADYGALLFSRIRQEIFRRHRIDNPRDRIPHFLFADEFQEFPEPESFSKVLKMGRKYRLACTLASPSYHDLDDKMQAALGIINNFIIFRLHSKDLPHFKHLVPKPPKEDARIRHYRKLCERHGMNYTGPPEPEPLDLLNIPNYHALFKIGSNAYFEPTRPVPKPPFPPHRAKIAQYIKKRTVQMFACNTTAVSHTEVDAPSDSKPDDIPPDPNPSGTVPSHGDKKKGIGFTR